MDKLRKALKNGTILRKDRVPETVHETLQAVTRKMELKAVRKVMALNKSLMMRASFITGSLIAHGIFTPILYFDTERYNPSEGMPSRESVRWLKLEKWAQGHLLSYVRDRQILAVEYEKKYYAIKNGRERYHIFWSSVENGLIADGQYGTEATRGEWENCSRVIKLKKQAKKKRGKIIRKAKKFFRTGGIRAEVIRIGHGRGPLYQTKTAEKQPAEGMMQSPGPLLQPCTPPLEEKSEGVSAVLPRTLTEAVDAQADASAQSTSPQAEKPQVEKSQDEKSQVEKPQAGKTQAEKSQDETTQAEKPPVEKTGAEKSQIEKSQDEKSQDEKSQVEKSQAEKTQAEKSQDEKTQAEKPPVEKTEAEKSQIEKSQDEKSQDEKSQVEKSQAEKTQAEKPPVEKTEAEKSQAEKPQAGSRTTPLFSPPQGGPFHCGVCYACRQAERKEELAFMYENIYTAYKAFSRAAYDRVRSNVGRQRVRFHVPNQVPRPGNTNRMRMLDAAVLYMWEDPADFVYLI